MSFSSDARECGKIFSLAAIHTPFTTNDADGDCAWGVEIKSAKIDNSRQLVFLTNANSAPVSFRLIRKLD
ncbi:MAG: hypothetical protein ACYC0V_00265 [Armatimonadota bacterium]